MIVIYYLYSKKKKMRKQREGFRLYYENFEYIAKSTFINSCDDGFRSMIEQQLFGNYRLDLVHIIAVLFFFHHGQRLGEILHFPVKYMMADNKYWHAVFDGSEKIADVLAFERSVVTGF